jgi:FGGY-family pentulose kinase
MTSERYVIGVDVGTGSARAGLFDTGGRMLANAVEPIRMWKPAPNHAEQSSEDIWRAVAKCTKSVLKQTGIPAFAVAGISFDATCSLVVLNPHDAPLPVNAEGEAARNIIVWMDHRAAAEADEINSAPHNVLAFVGGSISPEMEIPKLLWLKRHLPEVWASAGKFLDLADYLTYRSTGVDARSLCTMVCKWTFLGHEGRRGKWDRKFLRRVGLEDLLNNDRVVSDVRHMGEPLGPLTESAARDLGLTTGCIVGVGIIDAHAGGLGVLGGVWEDGRRPRQQDLERAVALIGGTSSCHMAVSREARFVPGVWGPYYSAMVPGMWLTEGGQSAAGAAVDHAIAMHPNASKLTAAAKREGRTVYELLNDEIARLQEATGLGPQLTTDLHVLPDFNGNRSPKADPYIRGVIDGLSLDTSITSQALLYYATVQAVAYGTRDIVRAMNRSGFRIDRIFATGGGTKNPVWLQEHADATGCEIILPREPEAVLLGTAMLAAKAAGIFPTVAHAMQAMSGVGGRVTPRKATSAYHRAKFRVFQNLYGVQALSREVMSKVAP